MKKVVIDAGHGGDDPGASGNGIVEKELTLEISQYIHDRLDELGIENTLIRDSDETIEPNDRVNKIVSPYGSDSDVLVVSNHINAGGGEGAEIIYALRNNDTFSRKISDELESMGRVVRKYYQRRYPSDSSKDYYFIHRNTGNTEAVIVEYGFLDNVDDANLLKKYWQDYAEAVVKAIANYLGVPYTFDGSLVNENYYIVKKGDTLYSIAKKYGLTVDELKKMNNLSSNTLSINQKLLVGNDMSTDNNYDVYVVKSGDTLWGIASKYNTSVDKIKDINNLNSNNLSIGQKLLVPGNNLGTKKYIVKSGDTLYKIAQNNGTTVTELINLNNLKTTNLSIGQVLYIP